MDVGRGEQYKSASEKSFLLSSARLNLRLDGRHVNDQWHVVIDIKRSSTLHSLVEVALGETRVICDVSGELGPTFSDAPNEGTLQVVASFASTASVKAAGVSGLVRQGLGLLEKSLQGSRAVDVESLCVVANSCAWHIKCVVTVMDDNGAAVDAASLAMMAGLLHFRRNEVTCVGNQVKVHSLDDRTPVPLSIHHIPLCVSIALFHNEEDDNDSVQESEKTTRENGLIALVDPTHREEAAADGTLVLALNAHNEVCGLSKSGDPPISSHTLAHLVELAGSIRRDRAVILERALLEHPF